MLSGSHRVDDTAMSASKRFFLQSRVNRHDTAVSIVAPRQPPRHRYGRVGFAVSLIAEQQPPRRRHRRVGEQAV